MGDFFYRNVVRAAKGAFRAMDYDVNVVGAENIPLTGGAVLSINHLSFVDFVFAGIPADMHGRRLVRFMAKEDVFTHRVSGPLMRSMSHIPVDRDAGSASFRAAVEALKAGELVGVFPEATMSRTMDVKPIKSGAVRMARAAKVPLVPMAVFGTQRISTYDHTSRARHIPVYITVGEPIPTAGDPEAATEALRSRMQELVDQTIARYPDRPTSPQDSWWMPARLGGTAPTAEQAEVIDAEAAAARAARRAAKQAEAAARKSRRS